MVLTNFLKTGIRGRIFLAFFAVSLLTFLTSLIGWISHNEVNDSFEDVVNVNIVAIGNMAELSKQTVLVTRTALTLVRSESLKEQEDIWNEVDSFLTNLKQQVANLKFSDNTEDQSNAIQNELGHLEQAIEQVNASAKAIKHIELEKHSFNQRMRWVTTQTLEQINKEIDRLSLTIQSQLNSDLPTGGYGTHSATSRDISAASKKLQLLNDLNAETNALTTIMDRAQYLPDSDSLIAIELLANSHVSTINDLLEVLAFYDINKSLIFEVNQVIRLLSGKESIFKLRRQQRSLIATLEGQQEELNRNLDSINAAIEEEAAKTEQQARMLVELTREQVVTNNMYLAFTALVSLLLSFLIGWKYVGKNIVGRILQLDKSMQDVATGNRHSPAPVGGDDEITTMGKSLISFHAQLELQQQELVQAAKLAALGQLSTGIAHEINQPLVAIRNYCLSSELLLKNGDIETVAENITEIKSLTVRATQIVSSLKSMARKEEQVITKIDISEVVSDVLKIMQGTIKESNVDLTIDLAATSVLADKIRLEQVLLNLVANAIDAIKDTEEKQVILSSWQDDDWAYIGVADSGEGISDDNADYIFDAFFTTKESSKGLGLGLAISYNIIKNLGGDLYWQPAENRGTLFIIKLPRAQ